MEFAKKELTSEQKFTELCNNEKSKGNQPNFFSNSFEGIKVKVDFYNMREWGEEQINKYYDQLKKDALSFKEISEVEEKRNKALKEFSNDFNGFLVNVDKIYDKGGKVSDLMKKVSENENMSYIKLESTTSTQTNESPFGRPKTVTVTEYHLTFDEDKLLERYGKYGEQDKSEKTPTREQTPKPSIEKVVEDAYKEMDDHTKRIKKALQDDF